MKDNFFLALSSHLSYANEKKVVIMCLENYSNGASKSGNIMYMYIRVATNYKSCSRPRSSKPMVASERERRKDKKCDIETLNYV